MVSLWKNRVVMSSPTMWFGSTFSHFNKRYQSNLGCLSDPCLWLNFGKNNWSRRQKSLPSCCIPFGKQTWQWTLSISTIQSPCNFPTGNISDLPCYTSRGYINITLYLVSFINLSLSLYAYIYLYIHTLYPLLPVVTLSVHHLKIYLRHILNCMYTFFE